MRRGDELLINTRAVWSFHFEDILCWCQRLSRDSYLTKAELSQMKKEWQIGSREYLVVKLKATNKKVVGYKDVEEETRYVYCINFTY